MNTREQQIWPGALFCYVVAAVALMVLLTVNGCRVPPPGTPARGPIACSVQALGQCWPTVLPAVNSCLVGDDASGCLLGLIQPTGCATEHVVACLVKNQGAEYAHAAQMNAADGTSRRAAENARAFIVERGYTFLEGP